MEILLNGKPLDVTLENEKHLGEIISGVESWLNSSDLVITSIKISDKELLSETGEQWKNRLIENIEQVALTVKPANEVHLSSMQNIIHFLTMLKKSFSQKDMNLLQELKDGFPFMIQSLTLLSKQIVSKSMRTQTIVFINHFPGIEPEKAVSWSNEEQGEAILVTDTLLAHLVEIVEEMEDPFTALEKLIEKIQLSIDEISEVSILLQTGKDRDAMNILVTFSDTLQKFLRIFLLLKDKKKLKISNLRISDMRFEEYYNELNGFLKELIDAFQINDSVLIGDLLEYEIAPRIEGLIPFIEKLKPLQKSIE